MLIERSIYGESSSLLIWTKVLDLAVTKEGDPSLGRDGSTYQEYIVPAFLTQVKPRRKNQEKAHDHVCSNANNADMDYNTFVLGAHILVLCLLMLLSKLW